MTDSISIFNEAAVSDEEQLYFDMIDRAAEAGQDRIISNGKAQHAVYLIHKFFVTAERNLRIYSGKLAEDLNGVMAFGDPAVCSAAVGFLSRHDRNRIDIVVEEPVDWSHPLLAAVEEAGRSRQVSVSQLKDDKPVAEFHFLLRDDVAFRVEVDKKKAEALVNFNDADFGSKLKSLFEWTSESLAKPVPAPT